ncbi:MAG TPA: YceI family protein [Elusimicrobiota bacterium]|nr:YceI family protein [Elusimicrobiota bacterium]HMX43365.1 YceI family protein [Elusimicrobiota bacterium]HMX95239.1 YceI family protein [Elusimicrobiota bacterium]HNA60703.1 YceI family protein [Elusimicrobiota bacterium]HNC74324.1 YceI family protein [Elusimicrobiota bacterium]
MRRFFLFAFLLVGAVGLRAGGWVLDSSTLTYRVTHRLHKVEGTSHGARGKGLCDGSGCRFLVAAPVNTFDSGDSNRDLHMIETTRGAQFPMVKVSVNLAAVPAGEAFTADLSIEFAGKSHRYASVPFRVADRSAGLRFTGQIPLRLTDFSVPAPSLLGMAVKDDVPVDVEMSWSQKP